ncbi:MAG TPA: 1-acyl-sn-glycerol-3-phosphate acyltransferase [Bacteroidales bacterium]|nr:1-acyl-sn-glycerol-3-phosphate acyltransferase [Bacteroidales bacterium]
MKRVVVDSKDLEHISPLFRGRYGPWILKKAMILFGIDRVNKLYGRSADYQGVEFTHRLLADLGIKWSIGNAFRLNQLPTGAFITISNHPYGGLDGVMLVDLIASLRPKYKFMVNNLVYHAEAMQENFISVIPQRGNKRIDPMLGFRGIKETLVHLKQGNPVGFFPAGGVSLFHLKSMKVYDREWQSGILKIIQIANVPVVPIRFFDLNSPFFYFLGVIDWRIRQVRMSYELFNKSKKPHRIGIGKTIQPEELAGLKDLKELENYLRKAVYEMPMPESFVPRANVGLQSMTDKDVTNTC